MLAGYDFIDEETLSYFKPRLNQAPRDAEFALAYVKEHAKTPEERRKLCARRCSSSATCCGRSSMRCSMPMCSAAEFRRAASSRRRRPSQWGRWHEPARRRDRAGASRLGAPQALRRAQCLAAARAGARSLSLPDHHRHPAAAGEAARTRRARRRAGAANTTRRRRKSSPTSRRCSATSWRRAMSDVLTPEAEARAAPPRAAAMRRAELPRSRSRSDCWPRSRTVARCSAPTAQIPWRWSGRRANLTSAEWARVFNEAAAIGVVQLHVSGGEPLVRPDVAEIVRGARVPRTLRQPDHRGGGLTPERG